MKKIMAALLAGALTLCSGAALAQDAQEVPELIEPVGVKLDTATVTRQTMYSLKYYDAAVVPHVDKLTFTVDGTIDSFEALIGDTVEQGDVLATLDQSELTEQAAQLQEKIEYLQRELEFTAKSDKLALNYAQIELERLTVKAAAGEVTAEQVKLKQADINLLTAQQKQAREMDEFEISTLKAQLTDAQSNLGQNTITAPYSGRIVYMKEMQRGTSIKAYEPIFYIANDDLLSIDSEHISTSAIAAADKIYVRIGDTDYDVVAQEVDWQEYVTIALSGGEVRTGFDFADPSALPDTVECGQYAAVFTMSGLVEDALAIPANALYSDSNGRYVYKIEGNTRVRTPVTVGRMTTISVQITDGLEEGDLVYVKE